MKLSFTPINLEREELTISKGETLLDLYKREGYPDNGTPTNRIIEKVEPGIGATYAELECKRNSVITEPNVPVIIGKTEGTDYLGIYEKTTPKQIEAYLQNGKCMPKKLVTTPEGYKTKLIPTFKKLGIDWHKEYFCLYDECEKLIQDTGFRPTIRIKDFFDYERKAYVSATPLGTRNRKFLDNGFKWLKVTPDYDYKKDATLIITRSFNRTLRRKLRKLLSTSKCICIFYKTTDGIARIVQNLLKEGLIKDGDYKVFCSDKSVKKLKSMELHHTHDHLELPLAKVNLFTARFFSAVDIKINKLADILVLSNYKQAMHSMIDPFTEAVQIQGRFRNKLDGDRRYNSLTFIANTNDELEVKSDEEIEKSITTDLRLYLDMKIKYDNETDETDKATILKNLNRLSFNEFLDDDEELSEEVIDHVFNEERVTSYYQSPEALINAYNATGHFRLQVIDNSHGVGEDDNLSLKKLSTKDVWKYLVNQLERLERDKQNNPDFDFDAEVRELERMNSEQSFIIEAYSKIGKAPIEAAKYSKSKIEKELKAYNLQQGEKLRFSPNVLAEIEEEFRNEVQIQCYIAKSDFIKRLGRIYTANGITYKIHGDGMKGNKVMCQITEGTVEDYFDHYSYNSQTPPLYKLLRFKSELGAN
ncbi:hypothetical protein [Bacteroides faecalis]|uniref:Uncharacterized protein n=1 Tax=Bacteroides faecalis TaxID=2447885 RepID=A0A401LPP8_9BACE|nr:hypothetical protein [Bacteroides faecalis]GCB33431.1 hypothetical protein KGMB02408_03760 [Bacteroides faecalis]